MELKTGFHKIDEKISILNNDLIVIAGRPSMGKTISIIVRLNFTTDSQITS